MFFKFATYEQKNIRIRLNPDRACYHPCGSNLFKRMKWEQDKYMFLKLDSDGIVKAMYFGKNIDVVF
jgi:hypothetical protein